MDNLSALFTTESLLSLQGSAAAALLVPAVLLYLIGDRFKPIAKWVSFVIALGLSYLVAALATDTGVLKWVLAFFNGLPLRSASTRARRSRACAVRRP